MKSAALLFLLSTYSILGFSLATAGTVSELPSAPSTTWEIGGMAQDGGLCGVRFSVYDLAPMAVHDPFYSGFTPWEIGKWIDFNMSYNSGALRFSVDWDNDGSLESNEKSSFTFSEYVAKGFKYIDLIIAGQRVNDKTVVRNVTINGDTVIDRFSNSGPDLKHTYFDLGDYLAKIVIAGEFKFSDVDWRPFTPRLDLRLGGDGTPVPVPGAAWLLSAGLIGLMAIRRRTLN